MSDPADPSNIPDPFASGADALRVEGLGSADGSATAAVSAGVNGTASVSAAGAVDGRPAADVIDLREAGTTRVRVSRDDNPFGALSKQERMRLIVRVLCEIVAYGELEEDGADPGEVDAAPVLAREPGASDLPVSNN